ncbi:hypothetical protein BofuT4_uP020010.1 [Botrytis cinerea T4]|uniref:Uncharacterized protein n=1 Tax=Botryotinia fuckeliana (strain T4) TaxID=999810 RepID=G2YJ08_BOTF4|nr:hypothetical protein BofuT4_uP020010.1 [Botrytis cinerea T4]
MFVMKKPLRLVLWRWNSKCRMCQGGNQEEIYLIRRGRLETIEQ